MTAGPVDDVVELLRSLRLPHMRQAAPELLATRAVMASLHRADPVRNGSQDRGTVGYDFRPTYPTRRTA